MLYVLYKPYILTKSSVIIILRGQDNMQKLRAGASTSVQKLGASIHICLSQDGDCLVSVVGAKALNQAIKEIIVAKSLLLMMTTLTLSFNLISW